MTFKTFLKGSLAAAAVATLSGCGIGGWFSSEPDLRRACPDTVPVVDAQELTRFTGSGGYDLTDVLFIAQVERVRGICEIDDEEITVELEFVVSAERGPANLEGTAPISYFVAIADVRERILTRESFDIEIEFEGNRTRVGNRDILNPVIPIVEGQDGRSFRIYYGLELSEQELEYNRLR